MTIDVANLHTRNFRLVGSITPLLKAAAAPSAAWQPTRPMGGWLMTYAKIGPNGGLQPTFDRDNQVAEVARELGHIDWAPYITSGLWNDTHNPECIVGQPTNLEFHDETTPLAKAHRKVGFWTDGYLFDPEDPESWKRSHLGREPTKGELQRADRFWAIAKMLKGTTRKLGFSAHGAMMLSPCQRRIVFARVDQAAVADLPKNPDATIEEVGGPLTWLRKGMVSADSPCAKCRCPPGACNALRKAVTSDSLNPMVPESLEGTAHHTKAPELDQEYLQKLIALVGTRLKLTPKQARNAVTRWMRRRTKESRNGHAE